MVYATASYKGQEKICYIDRTGGRAFLLDDFFKIFKVENPEDAEHNKSPKDMIDFIASYEDKWTDDIALFFGSRQELAIPLTELTLLAPIPKPARNLVCVGKNYQSHADELKDTPFTDELPPYPIYFTKPDHTVISTGANILLHEKATSKLDYEIELAVIISKGGINIPKEEAEEYIFGYTICNDITARDLQIRHDQWFKSKSLTTHCPMGPWIVHKTMVGFPPALDLKCYVNDELRQMDSTTNLLFDIPTIISDLSKGYELKAGDIILTGTPSGVALGFNPPKFLKEGDVVRCEIQGIGTITNTVAT